MLATKDAHGLYKQFGFTEITNPARFMELHRPDVYEALSPFHRADVLRQGSLASGRRSGRTSGGRTRRALRI